MNSAEVLIKFKGDTKDSNNAIKEQESKLGELKKSGELAFAGLTAAVDAFTVSILKSGVAYNAEIETYLTRLETLTGSAEDANKVLNQIKKDALATPFEVSSLTQAESLLLATGMSAEEARADILALGDAISASGGGNAELSRMAVNLQQIKNVGKASALDIKQFAYAGIDIYGLLADSMEITRAEAADLDVSYEMLSKALKKASSEGGKYYGAMSKQSKTYNGAMSNLKESVQVFAGAMSEGLFESLKKIIVPLGNFFDWMTKNKDVIIAIAKPLLTFVNVLAGMKIAKKITKIIKGLWIAMSANPISLIVAAIAALIVLFIELWNNCEGFRNFFIGMWEAIKTVVSVVIDAVISFIQGLIDFIASIPQKILDFITKIISHIQKLPEYIAYSIGVILDLIAKMFVSIWEFITKDIPEVIASVIQAIGDFFGKIGDAFIHFITVDLPEFIKSILQFFIDLPGKIWEAIKSIPGKIKDLANGMIQTAKNVIPEVVDTIIDFFSDLPANMVEIGKAMIKGLWEGIKSMGNWLWGKIKDFGNWIVDGFCDIFGIHSPSVVMKKEIGVNLGLGLEEGLMATQKAVNNAVSTIGNGINTNLSQSTLGTMQSTNLKPIFNVYVESNTDPLGQTVSNIKTFGNGAKNDYNYGVGV